MRKPVCILCGKEAVIEGRCEEHWLPKQELFEAEDFTLVQCDGCDRWLYKEWHDKADLLVAIKEAVRKSLKEKGKIEEVRMIIRHLGGRYRATVTATGTIPPATAVKEDVKVVSVTLKNLKCPTCVKMLGRYHEAVLQLRGENVEKIADIVAELCKGYDLRFEKRKEGYNLYFVTKSDATKIATMLRRKGFEVTDSYKLVGKKDGQELWKDFHAIR